MQLGAPQLTFPASFCCNCGDTNCMNEIQDTRVTRYFGIGGAETTFQLPVPVCAACRRSTRRRPPGFFARLLVFALLVCVWFLALIGIGYTYPFPPWLGEHLFWFSAGLGFVSTLGVFRLRRPRPPMTSFYQPVRIKNVSVQVTDLVNGHGHVAFMRLAFTNPDYLAVFVNANRDAIDARRIAAGKV
jgi:hypothetical protein